MDFIHFNTTTYNPGPQERRVIFNRNPKPLALPVIAPPFPNLDLPPLDNRIKSFWEHLATVVSRLPPCRNRYKEIYQHCQRINLQFSPLPCLLDLWIKQDFPDVMLNAHDTRFVSNFEPTAYCKDDILPDDYKAAYNQWNNFSWCQRYYITHCIGVAVEQERKEEEPSLDAWSLQILLCNILSGSAYLQEQSLNILSGLDLNVWCDRYLFAGGMLRNELLQASTAMMNENISKVLDIISSVMGKTSDWVAFFEHYDNLTAILNMLQENLFLDEALTNMLPIWKQLTAEDFKKNKCREGIFETVVQVVGDKVTLKYYGWPYPLEMSVNTIQDERILKMIKLKTMNL